MFTMNVGTWDRWLRILLGLGALSLVFIGPKTAWGWLGLLPVATGTLRYCPAYSLFGVSTVKKDGP